MIFDPFKNIEIVEAKTIFVDVNGDGNYTTIQYAIDNASDGDTINIWAGVYNEDIVINKPISIVGNGSINTTINGTGSGDVVHITSDWVNIDGLKIINSKYAYIYGAIFINRTDHCKIENSNCSNNFAGIHLIGSSYNNIFNNTINNNYYGMVVEGASRYNDIINNTCNNNGYPGIIIQISSSYNTIENNNCSLNKNGLEIKTSSNNNKVISNTFLSNSNMGISISQSSTSNTIENNKIHNNINIGIRIYASSNSNICLNNNITNSLDGIYISSAPFNKFFNNSLYSCGFHIEGNGLSYWSIHTIEINNTINGRPIYYWKNTNSGKIPGDAGQVILANCVNVTIDNLNITNISNGVVLAYSKNNTISNCNLSSNSNYGIYLFHSSNNMISNNNCSNNKIGIYLSSSSTNNISNNTCNSNNGINFNDGDGFHLEDSSDNNTFSNNKCENNYHSGLSISYSSGNKIVNNNSILSNYRYGFYILYSDNTMIMNNSIDSNPNYGIYQIWSENVIIQDNTFNRSVIFITNSNYARVINNTMSSCGLRLHGNEKKHWNTHTIDINNTVNNKPVYYWKNITGGKIPEDAGQVILANCSNIIIENIDLIDVPINFVLGFSTNNTIRNCSGKDGYYGLFMFSSSNNNALNNTFSNYAYGIIIQASSTKNNIKNNNMTNCYSGIFLTSTYGKTDCNQNTLENNTFNSNERIGIYLWEAMENRIVNNTCKFNPGSGIYFYKSHGNIIARNNLTKNGNGTSISKNSSNNTMYENEVSFNTIKGITITSSTCNNNHIYYNFMISNTVQAEDAGINYWNNSQQEGNYWSDYNGLDNGAGGRTKGDGIGDTNIPHLGLDNYPFVTKYGWLMPGTPTLADPGDIDIDGNYSVTWNLLTRSTGYILEEDTTGTFSSPVMIYNGSNQQFNFKYKSNGTYYYRAKAYNDLFISSWSTIVDIIVDWQPSAPTGLGASDITGYEIKLTWNSNPEPDVNGYHVYMNDSGAGSAGPYHQINTITGPTTYHVAQQLAEETTYFFYVTAYDNALTESENSTIVFATTLDVTAPSSPIGLGATAINDHEIELTWTANLDLDLAGYHIFMNDTNNGPTGNFHLLDTTASSENSYILSDLAEKVTYHFKIHAFDEVPNNSSFSNIASAATLDITPPGPPTGIKVIDATVNSLTITWNTNPETDVTGYFVYRSISITQAFEPLNTEPITETKFINTGLDEFTRYYYKLKAIDDADLESDLSDIANGMTILGPYGPEINNSIADLSVKEDSYDDDSISLYYWFKDKNNDKLTFRFTGTEHIDVTIFQDNGTVALKPEHNWNGKETITFYASDGTDEFYDDVTITVTYVNDAPGPAEIAQPDDGLEIEEGKKIVFTATCDDPDLSYGDILTFKWSSNISNEIGTIKALHDVILIKGHHFISLEVTDKDGKKAIDTIEVIINAKEDEKPIDTPDDDKDGMPDLWEQLHELDPLDPSDASKDNDNDGLSNYDEYLNGLDPNEPDTDNDDLKDGIEVNTLGTNASNPDTDSDGHNDKDDLYPLDPTKWEEATTEPDKTKPDEKKSNMGIIAGTIVIIIVVLILLFMFFIKPRMGTKETQPEENKEEKEAPRDPELRSYGSAEAQIRDLYGDSSPETPSQPQYPQYPEQPPQDKPVDPSQRYPPYQ